MVRALVGTAIVISVALAAAGATAADFKYVGAKKCRSCHKKELIGNQYGAWKEAKHSQAFETLKGDEALEVAKEQGISRPPSEAKECLKCHVTAYGADPAEFAKKPLDPADGVQCESCHGPGSGYKKKKTMSDHDKAVAAGMWEPDEETCTGCHNDESPSWDTGKYELADGSTAGFDFEQAADEIKHPIPEDVKGRYIEIEKKLKAEKKARGEADEEDEEEE